MNDQAFRQILEQLYPKAKFINVRPLTGGVSAEIHAVQYALPDGEDRHVVVRRHGSSDWKQHANDVASTEFALQTALFNAGLPVPEPLLLDDSAERLPSPYFVMAMVEGDMQVSANQLPAAIEAMAEFLIGLHALDVSTLGLPDALRSNEDPVKGALTYIPETNEYVELREAVSAWPITQNPPVLLHGDYWPNNILWKDGKIAAVLDWEDASIGTPVSDLAGARSELFLMYGEEAMNRFTEIYLAKSSVDVSDLPVWEAFAGYAALALMSEWGLPAEVEAERRQKTEIFAQAATTAILKTA